MAVSKTEVISFKMEPALAQTLSGMANRSEFIRQAVLLALEQCCPLCGGNGVLTAAQRRHWKSFERDHALERCGDCRAAHLVCRREDSREDRSGGAS